ncbi:ATP synthase regulation protein NCA2-domain-containing protein [Neohortaea acidophila]|uniref:ATP synthase regulation protein NCA2-domain-containing protein n=1 Tax=Neohortaea acidophila TaxID=245834 RepID=A0A6A6Q5A6_9PEZI|nr:ATP synthase regulation protein NCA2-domain-containing protein [Neohortaea acidophila]KAF2487628.1 ATP synthase regulation protein NCA2-domain-containing protein [Neohortaea acidophila]
MSFVLDQVRRIDAQLDRVQLSSTSSAAPLDVSASSSPSTLRDSFRHSTRILSLQAAIHALSPGVSDRRALLSSYQIQYYLSALSAQPEASQSTQATPPAEKDVFETELEWLLASKATTLVYGLAIEIILNSTVKIADDLWYWDEVLSSQRYTALYSAQVSPLRLWDWGSKIWDDVRARAAGDRGDFASAGREAGNSVRQSWREFYGLVRQVVRERSVQELHTQILSPVTRIRNEVREKQKALRRIRLRNANALGVLIGEGLANESVHGDGLASPGERDGREKWKSAVARTVVLMEAVLAKANDVETPVEQFDTAIAHLTEDDPLYAADSEDPDRSDAGSLRPEIVAERLSRVLTLALPQYDVSTKALVRQHGKPSRIIRYWIPVTVGILSSSTVLRILVNRQAEVVQWIQDLGATIIDFWRNWVVEPTRKVIGTIRHDEGSEVSIMSKRSLQGDRDSLERMVVDFAIANPADATDSGGKLTDVEIADIRAKVREGDLTPVLRAYEKDLSSPFMGTVRGNLIRALLIQVQKTKVDIEIAMGGIDALLKSQELVFGFVGLTPGILVTYFVTRSLRNSLSEKRGSKAAKKQGKMLRQLRNIDRILVDSAPTDFGELHYKDQGLLLCEVHVLRLAAEKVMPTQIFREFGEETEELCDVRTGIEKQKKVAERIRWAYGRWLA